MFAHLILSVNMRCAHFSMWMLCWRHADELSILLNGMALHGDRLAPPVSLSWRTPSPRASPRASPGPSLRASRPSSPAPTSNGSLRPISPSPEPSFDDFYDSPIEPNFSRRAKRLITQIRHVRQRNGGKKPSPVFSRNQTYRWLCSTTPIFS